MKICSKCKLEKQLVNFNKRSDGKSMDGLESMCKTCRKISHTNWYHKTKNEPMSRFKVALSASRNRNLDFSITKEDYKNLIKSPCYYCKVSIANEMGTGLDRIDNSKGYMLDNVVPCCGKCNFGRTDRFTVDEWKIMMDALLKYKADVAE